MGYSLKYDLIGPALYRLAQYIGRALGAVFYRVPPPGSKARMRLDLGSVLPGLSAQEIEGVIREFFKDYTLNKLDVFFYPLMGPANIDKFAMLEGVELLEAALAKGRGVVLIHAHLGNPQMLMPALGHRGYALRQVGLTPEDVYNNVREITGGRPNLPALIWLRIKGWLEHSLPVDFIHMGRASIREIYRSLEDNKLVAMTVDGVDKGDGVRGFFGLRCGLFVSGPARAAHKAGAVLLPLFVTRMTDGRHKVSLGAEIKLDPTAPRQEAVEAAMVEFLGMLEDRIKSAPHHYGRFLGFHNNKFFVAECEGPGGKA